MLRVTWLVGVISSQEDGNSRDVAGQMLVNYFGQKDKVHATVVARKPAVQNITTPDITKAKQHIMQQNMHFTTSRTFNVTPSLFISLIFLYIKCLFLEYL